MRHAAAIGVTVVALALAFAFVDVRALADAAARLPVSTLAWVVLLMLGGALLASVRLACIAADLGYRMRAVDAIAALSLGQLAGAIFFQLVGQLIARSALLARRGVPVAGTVAVTGYERLLALAVALVLGVAGGWFIFGRITLDIQAGGAFFLRFVAGAICAAIGSAALGWWRPALAFVRENMGRGAAWRIGRSLALSLAIQACTMAAYVAAAAALSPDTSLERIAAASAVVMLAASVPISLAGWGVRELGAVYVLGAIGFGRETALVVAVLVGAAGLLAVAILAAAVALARVRPHVQAGAAAAPPIDIVPLIGWALPVLAAVAVLFQVHVPLAASRINVNLADPLVLIAACLLMIELAKARQFPAWRLSRLNLHLVAMTAVLVLAFVHGWLDFGLTSWALTNRLIGWFILMAYVATGALAVRHGAKDGLTMLMRSFAGAAIALALFEIALFAAFRVRIPIPPEIMSYRIEAFAQNSNAFAVQLILAAAAILVGVDRARTQTLAFGVILAGIWFTGSKAGFVGVAVMAAAGLLIGAIKPARLAGAVAIAAAAYAAMDWLPDIVIAAVNAAQSAWSDLFSSGAAHDTTIVDNLKTLPYFPPSGVAGSGAESSQEWRLASLEGGFAMFRAHPVFGAGLGAFIEDYMRRHGAPLVIHSTPLWLLAEMGIVGLIIFAAPFVRVVIDEYRASPGDPARAFLLMALPAFAAIATVHDMLYQRSFWLLMGAALACRPASKTR